MGSLALLLATAILFVFTATALTGSSTAQPASAEDMSYGSKSAQVVVIEYSDFQCSICAEAAMALIPLREKYKDSVLFVFRFFPLPRHHNGLTSAQAAYAAFLQGKFWEMHDQLFARQQEWCEATDPYPYFDTYASDLGLDTGRFRDDYDDPATQDFLLRQASEAYLAGVTMVPWFVVNDQLVKPRGPSDIESFIRSALSDSTSRSTGSSEE
jgi:protein-disulfide isomerase